MAYVPVTDLSIAGQAPVCTAAAGGAALAARRERRGRLIAALPRASGHDAVRVLFACILLVAALLKTHQIATHLPTQLGLHGPVWMKVLLVNFELLLALWFLSNVFPLWVHRSALGLAMLFAMIALYRLLAGEASCGCFGRLTVHPGWTVAMDTLIAACLWRSRPTAADVGTATAPTSTNISMRVSLAFSAFLLLAAPASIWMMGHSLPAWGLVGLQDKASQTTVLNPDGWVGRTLPLREHIRMAEPTDLNAGSWTLLIYDHNCRDCQRLMAKWERSISRRGAAGVSAPAQRVALIDVAMPSEGQRIQHSSAFFHATLRDSAVWAAAVPAEISLRDGIVESVRLQFAQ